MNRLLLNLGAVATVASMLCACGSDVAAPNQPPEQPPVETPSVPASMSTEGTDEVQGVAPGPDGSVFVAGYVFGDAAPGDLQDYWFIRRYDRFGVLVWGVEVDRCQNPPFVEGEIVPGTLAGCTDGGGLKLNSDGSGNVYVLSKRGEIYNYGPTQVYNYVSKYGSDGALLWEQQVAEQDRAVESTEGWDILDLKANAAGDVFLLAKANYIEGVADDIKLLRYDASGSKLWEQPAGVQAQAALTVSDNSVYIAGVPEAPLTEAVPRLQRWRLDGTKLWERELPGTYYYDYLGLAAIGSRILLVSGTSNYSAAPINEAGINEITSLDEAGNVVWQEILAPEPYRGITAIAADAEGRLYLTGRASTGDSEDSSFLARYAADGDLSWEHAMIAEDKSAVSQNNLAPLALAAARTPNGQGRLGTTLYLGGVSFVNNGRTNSDAFVSGVEDVTEDPGYDQLGLDLQQVWLRN